jgi:uncharacterized membrane protein YdjX (TVP38/TMEM64 family)
VHNPQKILKIVTWAVLLVLILVLYLFQPPWLHTLTSLLVKGDIASIIEYIRSFGPNAMLISFLIVVAINAVAVLPNIFVLAANGIIFGVFEGTIISWLGESVGVTISFFLMRYLLRDYAHAVVTKSKGLKSIDEMSSKNGFWIMVVARTIPFVPSGLITALGALSSISIRDYILATLIGKFPSALIEVMMGHDLASYREHEMRLMILVLISVAGYWLFLRYKKRQTN